MRTILAPVDLSEISDTIVEQASCLAQSLTSKVYLLHVTLPNHYAPNNVDTHALRTEHARDLRLQRRKLHELAERLRRDHVRVVPYHSAGVVSTTIISEAERLNADIIVLGTHNHGNIYRMILGGIGYKVQHHASCPVMLVPYHESKEKAHWQYMTQYPAADRPLADTAIRKPGANPRV